MTWQISIRPLGIFLVLYAHYTVVGEFTEVLRKITIRYDEIVAGFNSGNTIVCGL